MPCLQQPEMYIGNASKLFDKDGTITVDSTRELFGKFVQAFAAWIETSRPR